MIGESSNLFWYHNDKCIIQLYPAYQVYLHTIVFVCVVSEHPILWRSPPSEVLCNISETCCNFPNVVTLIYIKTKQKTKNKTKKKQTNKKQTNKKQTKKPKQNKTKQNKTKQKTKQNKQTNKQTKNPRKGASHLIQNLLC